jgi:hypothetical protein
VFWELEQKIRSKAKKQNATQNHQQNQNKICALVLCIHVSFGCNQLLANCRVTIIGSAMQSGALGTRAEN